MLQRIHRLRSLGPLGPFKALRPQSPLLIAFQNGSIVPFSTEPNNAADREKPNTHFINTTNWEKHHKSNNLLNKRWIWISLGLGTMLFVSLTMPSGSTRNSLIQKKNVDKRKTDRETKPNHLNSINAPPISPHEREEANPDGNSNNDATLMKTREEEITSE